MITEITLKTEFEDDVPIKVRFDGLWLETFCGNNDTLYTLNEARQLRAILNQLDLGEEVKG